MAFKAIIVGSTGLIGSNLLSILLNAPEYDHVTTFVRKVTGIKHIKLREIVMDFDRLAEYSEFVTGHAIFCCLGTTRKKTPDLKMYRKIDHDYPYILAKSALKKGTEQYHLVSSIGADQQSSSFYQKIKGETERDIKQLGLPCLHIYQPSLLTGDRKEKRIVERLITILMKFIDPLLYGKLRKYRSIPAHTVAMAMFKESLKTLEGTFTHPSDKIKKLA